MIHWPPVVRRIALWCHPFFISTQVTEGCPGEFENKIKTQRSLTCLRLAIEFKVKIFFSPGMMTAKQFTVSKQGITSSVSTALLRNQDESRPRARNQNKACCRLLSACCQLTTVEKKRGCEVCDRSSQMSHQLSLLPTPCSN